METKRKKGSLDYLSTSFGFWIMIINTKLFLTIGLTKLNVAKISNEVGFIRSQSNFAKKYKP